MNRIAVVGSGINGLFVARFAAERGLGVTVFESQDSPATSDSRISKARSSEFSMSVGSSRRLDLLGNPLEQLVQLESLREFAELEAEIGEDLLSTHPLFELGSVGDQHFERAIDSARASYPECSQSQLPGSVWEGLTFHLGSAFICSPERVLEGLRKLLVENGVTFRAQRVARICATSNGVTLKSGELCRCRTSGLSYSEEFDLGDFDGVVVAAGVSLGEIIPELDPFITLRQIQYLLCGTTEVPSVFRTFRSIATGAPGFAVNPLPGQLVARVFERGIGTLIDRATINWPLLPEDPERAKSTFGSAREVYPSLTELLSLHQCIYAVTPDWLPVVGVLPSSPRIGYIGGCSGAAFKKAPVLAREVLSQLLGDNPIIDLAPWSFERFL